jgi:hypothetical protein
VDAVKKLHQHICQGYTDVVDADMSGWFESISHDDLIKSVARRIVDAQVLRLIESRASERYHLPGFVARQHSWARRERDLGDAIALQRSAQQSLMGRQVTYCGLTAILCFASFAEAERPDFNLQTALASLQLSLWRVSSAVRHRHPKQHKRCDLADNYYQAPGCRREYADQGFRVGGFYTVKPLSIHH